MFTVPSIVIENISGTQSIVEEIGVEKNEPQSTLQRNVSIATPIIMKFQPNMEKSQHNMENFDIQNVKIKYNKMGKRVSTQSK